MSTSSTTSSTSSTTSTTSSSTTIYPGYTTGEGISVARIPGSGEDEIWMVVKRVIKGSTVYYLEQMQPRDYGDLHDAWFVDSGISYDSVPTSTISGLDHLEGERVAVWADGAVQTSKIVNGAGQITLDTVASRVIAGLPYRSTIKPMRFDVMTGEGTSKGSIKRFAELVV